MPLTDLVADVRTRGLASENVLAALARLVAARVAPQLTRASAGPLFDGTIPPADLGEVALPTELLEPELLGDALELLHDQDARRRQGAFFTPHASGALVVSRAIADWTWPERPRVCDPACGGGAFLLAVARVLEARGLARDEIVDESLWGIDADPLAVATTQAALSLWCAAGGSFGSAVQHVVIGDTLTSGLDAWAPAAEPFDLVLGNPPFQSQLASRTARSREQAKAMAAKYGAVARTYADSSTLFLVAASTMTIEGGRFALILPESFLAARDAAPARMAVSERAALVGLWLPGERLFSVSVRVCVPVFAVGAGPQATIRRWRGGQAIEAEPFEATEADLIGGTWAPLAADLLGVPNVDVVSTRRLGSVASATAGFRDQFYGLRPFVRSRQPQDQNPVTLVTSGAIDLVNDLSSRRPTKFAGATHVEPVVEMERVRREDPSLARWAERVLVPKVVVATQTRLIELLVDETGTIWPSVPVVAVVAPPDQLWPIAAALASPPVSALSLRRHAGAALTHDAIKMSAKQVLDVPLPGDDEAWQEGVVHLQAAAGAARDRHADAWARELRAFGVSMCRAYGASDAVLAWWVARLPDFR